MPNLKKSEDVKNNSSNGQNNEQVGEARTVHNSQMP